MQQEVQASADHIEANKSAANLDVVMGTDCKAVYAARATPQDPSREGGAGLERAKTDLKKQVVAVIDETYVLEPSDPGRNVCHEEAAHLEETRQVVTGLPRSCKAKGKSSDLKRRFRLWPFAI